MTITSNEAAIVAAGVAALGSIGASIIALLNRGKLDVIHVLVNSNLAAIKKALEDALAENERLRLGQSKEAP